MAYVLRVSEAFTIGMHATALLARHSGNLLRVKKIAEQCQISEAHLAKVLQKLSRSGIVKGERGPSGGFALNRSAEEISLMDVWDAIEGRSQADTCPFLIPSCKDEVCSLGRKFIEANRRIEDLMKSTTLRELGEMITVQDLGIS